MIFAHFAFENTQIDIREPKALFAAWIRIISQDAPGASGPTLVKSGESLSKSGNRRATLIAGLKGNRAQIYFFCSRSVGSLFIWTDEASNIMRRSREQIAAGILRSCVFDKLTVTRLMAIQNLSYKLLRSHLDRLVAAGLLQYEEESERKVISTTTRGAAVSRCYGNAIALLNGSDAPCPLLAPVEMRDSIRKIASSPSSSQ